PWYEYFPLDFVSENLVPWTIRDIRRFNYALQPLQKPNPEDVANRAEELRLRGQAVGPLPGTDPAARAPAPPPVPPLGPPTPVPPASTRNLSSVLSGTLTRSRATWPFALPTSAGPSCGLPALSATTSIIGSTWYSRFSRACRWDRAAAPAPLASACGDRAS